MFDLPETVTLWRRTGGDGFGWSTWSAPEEHAARIAYSQQKFTDINGDTAVSSAVCYLHADISQQELRDGVVVLLGQASVDPGPPAAADDVRAMSTTPSGAGTLRKLWFA